MGSFVELGEEAEETGADHDVQDAADDWRGGVEEFQVRFEDVEVDVAGTFGRRPDDIVVIGEGREEDPEEEARRWSSVNDLLFLQAVRRDAWSGPVKGGVFSYAR